MEQNRIKAMKAGQSTQQLSIQRKQQVAVGRHNTTSLKNPVAQAKVPDSISIDSIQFPEAIKKALTGKVPDNIQEAIVMDVTGDIIGIIPVVGDFYVPGIRQVRARDLKLPENIKQELIAYDSIDAVIGVVPIAGDAVDFVYFPNTIVYYRIQQARKKKAVGKATGMDDGELAIAIRKATGAKREKLKAEQSRRIQMKAKETDP